MADLLHRLAFVLLLILSANLSLGSCQRITSKDGLKLLLETVFNMPRSPSQGAERTRVRTNITMVMQSAVDALPSNLAGRVLNSTVNFNSASNNAGQNIVYMVKGVNFGQSTDKPILVGANYDTAPASPGVNNDGSGMAALLEIGRSLVSGLQNCTFNHTIILVAFDLGEDSIAGSNSYVGTLTTFLQQNGLTASSFQGAFILAAMLNFDETDNSQTVPAMLATEIPYQVQLNSNNNNRGNFLAAVGRQDDNELVELVNSEWYNIVGGDFNSAKYKFVPYNISLAGHVSDFILSLLGPFIQLVRYDQFSFWEAGKAFAPVGLKAVLITDTVSYRGYMQQCNRQACDDVSKISDERLQFLNIGADAILRAVVILSTGASDAKCLGANTSGNTGSGPQSNNVASIFASRNIMDIYIAVIMFVAVTNCFSTRF